MFLKAPLYFLQLLYVCRYFVVYECLQSVKLTLPSTRSFISAAISVELISNSKLKFACIHFSELIKMKLVVVKIHALFITMKHIVSL